MPLIKEASYKAPFPFYNGHLQTIYPYLIRRVKDGLPWQRERVETPDGDFLDLDWCLAHSNSDSLVVMGHGLEGSSSQAYIRGMARGLADHGMDILAWNCRSCSGQMNRLPRFYHSGETQDLDYVLEYALKGKAYDQVFLVGFSMGGNIILKYLGEQAGKLKFPISRAVAVSTPCDLKGCSLELLKKRNLLYAQNFLFTLKRKLYLKSRHIELPDVDLKKAFLSRNLLQWDDRVTAPLHGFADAWDYYIKASSLDKLQHITVPTLLLNAQDDPFLSESSYPESEAKNNQNLFLEVPRAGGHVGFVELNSKGEYWSERRCQRFIIQGY